MLKANNSTCCGESRRRHLRRRYESVNFAELPTSLRPSTAPFPKSPASTKIA